MKDIASDAKRLKEYFNGRELPFYLECIPDRESGEYVVARWKWEDEAYFSPLEVTDEIKSFAIYFKLEENGKYRYYGHTAAVVNSCPGFMNDAHAADDLGSNPYARTWSFQKTWNVKKDGVPEKENAVVRTISTASVKKPVMQWLKENGYKKRPMTYKEFIFGLQTSIPPAIASFVGGVFVLVGSIFAVIGAVVMAGPAKFLPDFHYYVNGVEQEATINSVIYFGVFFACFGLLFVAQGAVMLAIHLPVFLAERRK